MTRTCLYEHIQSVICNTPKTRIISIHNCIVKFGLKLWRLCCLSLSTPSSQQNVVQTLHIRSDCDSRSKLNRSNRKSTMWKHGGFASSNIQCAGFYCERQCDASASTLLGRQIIRQISFWIWNFDEHNICILLHFLWYKQFGFINISLSFFLHSWIGERLLFHCSFSVHFTLQIHAKLPGLSGDLAVPFELFVIVLSCQDLWEQQEM